MIVDDDEHFKNKCFTFLKSILMVAHTKHQDDIEAMIYSFLRQEGVNLTDYQRRKYEEWKVEAEKASENEQHH